MLQIGGDPAARPADFGADLFDVGLGLRDVGGAGAAGEDRNLEGNSQLKVVALEPREKFVVVVEAREQRVLRDQVGLGNALRPVALDLQVFALEV
jgi:hypothetical protein